MASSAITRVTGLGSLWFSLAGAVGKCERRTFSPPVWVVARGFFWSQSESSDCGDRRVLCDKRKRFRRRSGSCEPRRREKEE